jgi:hypothetical protein
MNLLLAASSGETQSSPKPWVLPSRALTLYYGRPEMPRLSHYFLSRVLLAEKRILYLVGANQVSPPWNHRGLPTLRVPQYSHRKLISRCLCKDSRTAFKKL